MYGHRLYQYSQAQSLGTVSTVLYAREVVEDDFDSSDDFEIEDMDEQDEHGQI